MKCNWCREGKGRNYTKDQRTGVTYFYYCYKCIGDITGELTNPQLIEEFLQDLYALPRGADYIQNKLHVLCQKWEQRRPKE